MTAYTYCTALVGEGVSHNGKMVTTARQNWSRSESWTAQRRNVHAIAVAVATPVKSLVRVKVAAQTAGTTQKQIHATELIARVCERMDKNEPRTCHRSKNTVSLTLNETRDWESRGVGVYCDNTPSVEVLMLRLAATIFYWNNYTCFPKFFPITIL